MMHADSTSKVKRIRGYIGTLLRLNLAGSLVMLLVLVIYPLSGRRPDLRVWITAVLLAAMNVINIYVILRLMRGIVELAAMAGSDPKVTAQNS